MKVDTDPALMQAQVNLAQKQRDEFKQELENAKIRHKRELHKVIKGKEPKNSLLEPITIHGTNYFVHPVVMAYISDIRVENVRVKNMMRAKEVIDRVTR